MKKKGSGRTKGATSCVLVPLWRVMDAVPNDKFAIPVNRRWAKEMGITVKYVEVDIDEQRLESSVAELRDMTTPVDFVMK
jgi:hypothetical protein